MSSYAVAPANTPSNAFKRLQTWHNSSDRVRASAAARNTEASAGNATSGLARTAEVEECQLQAQDITADQAVSQAAPRMLQPALAEPLPAVSSPPASSETIGLLWAISVVAAIRLGRASSETDRLKLWIQEYKAEDLIEDQTLLKRRREGEAEEARQREGAAARRVQLAKQRAAERAKERAEWDALQQQEAAAEATRLRAEREAKRASFEAAEAKLQQELAERAAVERRLLAEKETRLREEREREARRRELVARQRAEEAAQREAEQREAEAAARRAREELQRELRKLQQSFALRLEGSARLSPPQKGQQTKERFPRDAAVVLQVACGSVTGGSGAAEAEAFASLGDAREACISLAGRAARAAADRYESSVRLQALTNEGPLTAMDAVELQHWMHIAATRAAVAAVSASHDVIDKSKRRITGDQRQFQMRTQYAVLPADHPQATASLLERAIAAIEGETQPEAASAVLRSMMADEDAMFYTDLKLEAPRHLGAVLVLAHFLDRMLSERPARKSDAPAWFESAAALMRRELQQLTRGSPQDTLTPLHQYIEAVLGPGHPVSAELGQLAAANESPAVRQARLEKQRVMEAYIAAMALEEEWPDSSDIAAERAAQREAATPLPERVWALRNVAATLALGGPGELSRARQLLEKALQLKEESVKSATEHPALLPELAALGDVLARQPQWADDLRVVRARQLRILQLVAARYHSSGTTASAVILLEAAIREFEETLGLRHPGIVALSRRAEQLFETLPSEARAKVSAKRRETGVLSAVAGAFSDDLAAYSRAAGSASRAALWDRGSLEGLPRLDA